MPLTKMEHYLVLTDDIDATRDFYCQALGMHVGFRPPLGFRVTGFMWARRRAFISRSG